jgi:dipeptidyl aminopeptidase/acylaminoacyl peptidase
MFEARSDGSSIYWLCSRPAEHGRNALLRWNLRDDPAVVVPAPWDVRTRVFEYGGGAYVAAEDAVWFVHFADGRIYCNNSADGEPRALTPQGPWRHAELLMDTHRSRLIALRECFEGVPAHLPEERSQIVAVDLATGATTVLFEGPDFLASPQLSPDGLELAWISWDHPHMPWDRTNLHCARFAADGSLSDMKTESSPIAQARMQPRFAPNSTLYYLGDADGWWNLHRWDRANAAGTRVSSLKAEIGAPSWFRGASHYAFLDADRVVAAYTESGYWRLSTLDLATGALLDRSERYGLLSSVVTVAGRAFAISLDWDGRGGLCEYTGGTLSPRVPIALATAATSEAISRAVQLIVPIPPSRSATEDEICYAWYYPPASNKYVPIAGERPAVVVQFHGGPTAASHSGYSLSRQFWTSRGFAVLDVNYRGSSGRGRAYRHRLYGHWGEIDVEDAVASLRHAAALGLVDASRAIITGASAGGYTTLAALAFYDAFTAGINLFGVSDVATMVRTTHKFERHYLRSLIGDWDADPDLLRRRSPLQCLDGIRVPLLTLQGSDDRVVPPSQSEQVMEAVRNKGVPCAYVLFEGEGHGFRRRDSLVRTLEASLSFVAQVFGIALPDDMARLVLDNAPNRGGSTSA